MLLTAVCIASFIMGIWNFAGGISSAFTDTSQRELAIAKVRMEESLQKLNGAGEETVAQLMGSAVTMAERTVENAKPLGYSAIILAVIGLVGVWLMWKLKRMGFWIYSVASITGLVIPAIVLGGGIMTMVAVGFSGVVAVAFIVLYAVHLKHMR